MSSVSSVRNGLLEIISRANAVTGSADATVSDAVGTLIAGYGKGGGITPEGTINISQNGVYDVKNYETANVNVDGMASEQICVVHPVTIASTLGNGVNSDVVILSNDNFVKSHYSHDGFAAMLIPVLPMESETNVVHSIYHGNANIGSASIPRYGFYFYNSSENVMSTGVATAKLNGTGYNASLRANSSGNVNLYVATHRIVKAGNYLLALLCTD